MQTARGVRARRARTSPILLTTACVAALVSAMPFSDASAQTVNVSNSVSADVVPSGETFSYTLGYSCAGLDCNEVTIVDALDADIEYVSSIGTSHVSWINHSGGLVTVEFLDPLPAGSTGQITLNVRFPRGVTPDGAVAENQATIHASNAPSVTSETTTTTATAESHWDVVKTLATEDPFIDDDVTYLVQLCSPDAGDIGGLDLLNATLIDTLETGSEFVSATNGGVYDAASHSVTWALGSIGVTDGGCTNRTIVVRYPSGTFSAGDIVTNRVSGFGEPVGQTNQYLGTDTATHDVQEIVYSPGSTFDKRVDFDEKVRGQDVTFTFSVENTGNTDLAEFTIDDPVPAPFAVNEIYTGTYNDARVELTVLYRTNLDPTFRSAPGSPFGSTNETIDPSAFLAGGETITDLRWSFGESPEGMASSSVRPGFRAELLSVDRDGSSVDIGDFVSNCGTLSYRYDTTDFETSSCEAIEVIGPTARPSSQLVVTSSVSYIPGSTVSYRARIRNYGTATADLQDPISAILLDEGTAYLDGSWTLDDRGLGAPTPNFESIDDYNGTGRTLLRWSWTDAASFSVPVNAAMFLYYDTEIQPGTLFGTLENRQLLTASAGDHRNVGSQDTDSNDLDGDGNTTEKLSRGRARITVPGVPSLDSYKGVRGSMSDEFAFYPNVATTVEGGLADYILVVKNTGNVPINDAVFIDRLPFVGDGLVLGDAPRHSEWGPNLVGSVEAPGGVQVHYSEVDNPCRDELGVSVGDCDDPAWSVELPADVTAIRALKFEFGDLVINPLDSLVIRWPMRAPVGAPTTGEVAYNSFGYTGTRVDTGQRLLAAEPPKVGVDLGATVGVSIGSYAWLDENRDGIFDESEPGLNGVLVELFAGSTRATGEEPVSFTRTGDDADGRPGNYLFPDVDPGTYTLRFTPPGSTFETFDFTLHAVESSPTTDSDADASTGVTAPFTVTTTDDLTRGAGFYRVEADLSLTKVVSNPAPFVNDPVVFTVSVTNDGPGGADGVAIDLSSTPGLSYISHELSRGDFDPESNRWTVGDLGSGSTQTMWLVMRVETADPIECTAEVSHSNAPDLDSTPSNAVLGEDDIGFAALTAGFASSGTEAGLESDGRMATILAELRFARQERAARLSDAGARVTLAPFRVGTDDVAAGPGGFSRAETQSLLPTSGPGETSALVSTPSDLYGATNATSVVAVDYVTSGSRRLAAIFATTTPRGDTYDHTKAICDRLRGARLDGMWHTSVGDAPFIMTRLGHETGVDYAVSFIAIPDGEGHTVDCRFTRREYDVPTDGDGEVLNFQVWSISPVYTEALVANILDNLAAEGPVTFLNEAENPPILPNVYVRTARYAQGTLELDLVNDGGAGALTLEGVGSDVEGGDVVTRTFEVAVPAPRGDAETVRVVVETGPVFDYVFTVANDANDGLDQLYLSDGAWGRLSDDASDVSIDVAPQAADAFERDGYVLERGISASGTVREWASVFRHLNADADPVNLTAYNFIEFEASGSGTVELQLRKASIAGSDQFAFPVELSIVPFRYRIYFDRFARNDSDDDFVADDLTTVTLRFTGDGTSDDDVSVVLRDAWFGDADPTENPYDTAPPPLPSVMALRQNTPNPFNPRTTFHFDLPRSAEVRLRIFDVRGRHVDTVVTGRLLPGVYSVPYDAAALSSGVYFYRLDALGTSLKGRMVLLR